MDDAIRGGVRVGQIALRPTGIRPSSADFLAAIVRIAARHQYLGGRGEAGFDGKINSESNDKNQHSLAKSRMVKNSGFRFYRVQEQCQFLHVVLNPRAEQTGVIPNFCNFSAICGALFYVGKESGRLIFVVYMPKLMWANSDPKFIFVRHTTNTAILVMLQNWFKDLVERHAFGVCQYLGEKMNIAPAVVRRYFIYCSCASLGSPILLYLVAAFWLNVRSYIRRGRSVLWE